MPSRTDGESAEKSDLDSDYERSLVNARCPITRIFVEHHATLPLPPLRFNPITTPYSNLSLPIFPKPSGYERVRTRNQYPNSSTNLARQALNEPVVPHLAYEMSIIGEKGIHLDTNDCGEGEHTPHEYQDDGAEVVSAT
ncbi:hypothetical protein L202_04786 [Cryptococcus amylolentus CBS 6039]|uniref:Uncharacterized protein n=1 Tax=Cryptococcus amylolentus CBS 6039 TaxID=1295533 RepID=A0A1E3HMR9_9TREE|nr:hypothetical protein L202_04786 [Cryptococcus amylolentus CBS 6039]ODN77628.1 hypothetical protein L202_04786 [Cryptococcus amylolentus CBS 6039]